MTGVVLGAGVTLSGCGNKGPVPKAASVSSTKAKGTGAGSGPYAHAPGRRTVPGAGKADKGDGETGRR